MMKLEPALTLGLLALVADSVSSTTVRECSFRSFPHSSRSTGDYLLQDRTICTPGVCGHQSSSSLPQPKQTTEQLQRSVRRQCLAAVTVKRAQLCPKST